LPSNWRDLQSGALIRAIRGAAVLSDKWRGSSPDIKFAVSMCDSAPPRAAEVRALAHQLLSWADHLSDRPDLTGELTEEGRHDLVLGLATALREARRLRAEIFPERGGLRGPAPVCGRS
jgi:hypothetical protein